MDGSLAEYLLADSHNVLPLPDELDFTDAVWVLWDDTNCRLR